MIIKGKLESAPAFILQIFLDNNINVTREGYDSATNNLIRRLRFKNHNDFGEYIILYEDLDVARPSYDKNVLCRLLLPDAPRLKYTRKTGRFKRQLHWGQLKLFLTEIEFINLAIKRYGKDRKFYVLYVGAAPGNGGLAALTVGI
jgi:hypothetical protein